MKLIVCVKQVPDTSGKVAVNPNGTLNRASMQTVINPDDKNALEAALEIKEETGAHVVVVSMGPMAAAGMLHELLAMGADEAVLVSGREFGGSDTFATSQILAAAVHKIGIGKGDLVLCGRQAIDGDTAQVGPMLAECLSIPHVSDVAEIESVNEEKCTVRKMTDDGYVRLEVRLPALLTVLKEINIPRLPSVSGVLRGEKAGVGRMTREDLGIDPETTGLKGSATRVVSTERPVPARETVWIEGTPEAQGESTLPTVQNCLRDENAGCRNINLSGGKTWTQEGSCDTRNPARWSTNVSGRSLYRHCWPQWLRRWACFLTGSSWDS